MFAFTRSCTSARTPRVAAANVSPFPVCYCLLTNCYLLVGNTAVSLAHLAQFTFVWPRRETVGWLSALLTRQGARKLLRAAPATDPVALHADSATKLR